MYSELRETFLDKLRNLDINIKKDLKDIRIWFTSGNNNLTIYVANYIHKYVSQNVREKWTDGRIIITETMLALPFSFTFYIVIVIVWSRNSMP